MTNTDPRPSLLRTALDVLAVGALATTAGVLYVASLVLVALAGCGGSVARETVEEPFGWCCDDFCGLSARDSEYFESCECAGIETGGDGVGRGECIEPLTE